MPERTSAMLARNHGGIKSWKHEAMNSDKHAMMKTIAARADERVETRMHESMIS